MLKQFGMGLTLFVATLGTSQAALYSGSYELTDATANYRGIWLNNGGISVNGTSDHSFEVQNASFDVTGNTARLHGRTESDQYLGGLDFDVDLDFLCTSGVSDAGGNNVSVDNAACGLGGNQPTGGNVSGAEADGNTWDFWNYAAPGMFTLSGWGILDGLSLTIEQKPTNLGKPFRFGIGADWDNESLLGGSGWFRVTGRNYTSPCVPNGHPCPVISSSTTAGDFNLTAVVPEPPMVAMFALGLLAAGFAARRSRPIR